MTANVVAGERVLEVGRAAEGSDGFVGKLFCQQTAEETAKGFARKLARPALELQTYKVEALRFATTEPLYRQRETLFRMGGDG